MYSHQITVIFPSTKLISVCSTNIYNNDIVFVSWGLMDNGVFGHQWEWNVHLQSGRQVGQQSFHLYNYPTFKREHSRSIRWGISQVMRQKRCLSGATQSVWKKTVATELSVALGTWVTTVLYSKKKRCFWWCHLWAIYCKYEIQLAVQHLACALQEGEGSD